MINILKGNILNSKAEAIINTVNTKGIMGKGIALQFKNAYPEMFNDYQKACKEGIVTTGKMHIWKNTDMFGPKYIINFPTKDDWKQKSKIEYIEKGLADLVLVIKELGISSIAIPPLGCGNGGLNWVKVKNTILDSLKPLNTINIELYEPSGSPDTLIKNHAKIKKMTLTRALVLKLFYQYCILGYELTLLEVQKLCFFLQEFGEPLRLRFKKHSYGPYADNVRHVLIDFEGIYTKGFSDGTNNTPYKTIKLLPDAITESDKFIESNKENIQKSLTRLTLVKKLIEGYETPFGMELLSTVFWLIKHDGLNIDSNEEIIKAVHKWNPRKEQIMKPDFVNKAISRIKEFQIVN